MDKAAAEGTQKIEELSSKLEALKAEKTQVKQDQEKAQSLRTKENGEFTEAELDMQKNIGAMKNAIAALEKGMGNFLQLPQAQKQLVQRLIATSADADDFQKQ